MANIKISDLPAVTVPLAGTEEMPVVQGGVTKRTAINNILSSNTISYIANGLGAVATPSYTFTGDLNTGMFSPAADTIAFSKGGIEVLRIENNGNVGIGTTTPEAVLDINGSQIARGDANGYSFFTPKYGTGPFGTNYDRFEIRVDPTAQVTNLGNTHGGTGSARALAFLAGTNERMRITDTGNVGIGTSSPTVALDVVGGIKTSRTAVTAPATSDGNIFSGTYSPTLTNIANIDIPASTAYTCQYMRVGDVVTVSGRVAIAVTGTGLTRLNMTLPIASNFSVTENCAGTAQVAYSGGSTNLAAQIRGDVTNDTAQILYYGTVTGAAQDFFFTFTYRII